MSSALDSTCSSSAAIASCSAFLTRASVSSWPLGSFSKSTLPRCRHAPTSRNTCSFSSADMLSTSMAPDISIQSFSSLIVSTVVTPDWFM